MEAIIIALGILFVVFVVILYSSLSWGFVAFKFYNWFMLPTFTELPQISVVQFIGIILFIGVLTHKSTVEIKDEYKDKSADVVMLLFSPWITLFIGWFIKVCFF